MECFVQSLNLIYQMKVMALQNFLSKKYDKKVGENYFPKRNLNVIDISITPNRADCLGVRGIARDLAAAGSGKLKN